MNRPAALREPMDMPDPYFPVKLHTCRYSEIGRTIFPFHWHEHLELLYFTRGEAVIECNSDAHQVRKGDVIVLNSNDLHQGVCMSGDLEYYALIADMSLLQSPSPDALEIKFIAPITQNRILFQNRISDDLELNACMDAIISEFAGRQLGYELSVKSYMYRLLTILVRSYVAETVSLSSDNSRRKNLERFAPIFDYIEEHYLQVLSVSELSRMAGLSRFHFSRLFSELTGRTVTEYVNQIRIGKSEYLLRNTAMTISEIALATGYQDLSYFSRTFKKFKSVPPSEFRTASLGGGEAGEAY
ncbi:AraC family transcriptional regulator [Paenibacillus caui]|uniref:AraC family transcriptional regulator n=1 Tax=Paenibacillus caui TaxID=2873927 RepID=UPI001CA7F156|nr:AraC family transcriptional regulator [Paenibacillus caui]